MGYKKLSKKEINKLISTVHPRIYINDIVYHEKFKQVLYLKQFDKHDEGIYLPYIISSFGRLFVINRHGVLYEMSLKPNVKNGYIIIILNYNKERYGTTVHRLVADMFIKNKNKKKNEVNHIDGIKTHNFIWNLEWVTSSENTQHAIKNNLAHFAKGEKSGKARYKNKQIEGVCKLLENPKFSKKDISKITNVDMHTVNDIYKGRHWRHISSNYDFSKRIEFDNAKIENIKLACELITQNKSLNEIEAITGIAHYNLVYLLHKRYHKDIVKDYDFSKYNYGK